MARRHRRPYPPAFKQQMVELVRAGRSPAELAREFEPSDEAIRAWVRQADADDGKAAGLTTAERQELSRLRRENKQLKLERQILAKAAAWFARETSLRRGVPRRGSQKCICHTSNLEMRARTELEVIEAFKGVDRGDVVEITHRTDGAVCGYEFHDRWQHVIFTDGTNWTICNGQDEPTQQLLDELRAMAETD